VLAPDSTDPPDIPRCGIPNSVAHPTRSRECERSEIAAMHAVDAGATTNEAARKYAVPPKLIERWRGEWRPEGAEAFPGDCLPRGERKFVHCERGYEPDLCTRPCRSARNTTVPWAVP
jgi:transposase-like protein